MQIILSARHRDIKQTAFLFQLLSGARTEVRRDAAVDNVQDEDGFPLLALRRVDRGQDQVILIKQRYTGLVAGGVRRVERELGQEALARRVAAGNLLELNQISLA